jgi:hypothetical protein
MWRAAPFTSLLWWRDLPAIYYCQLCLPKSHMESSSLSLPLSPVEGLACWLLLQARFAKSSHGEQLLAPPPFSNELRSPCPLCCVWFSVHCLLFSLFFAWQESICPGVYAGLSQGWLWEYPVQLICSPVGLHLPSRFGTGTWRCRITPGFSV